MAPFDKPYTTSYQTTTVSIALSCIIFKLTFKNKCYSEICQGSLTCELIHNFYIAEIQRHGLYFAGDRTFKVIKTGAN